MGFSFRCGVYDRAFIHKDASSMDNQTPKPMRKVRRNLFEKVGRKLEKFEQSLNVPNRRASVMSLDDYAESDPHQQSEQEDTVSLQYIAQRDSDTPKAVFRQNHDARFVRPDSSASLHDGHAVNPTSVDFDSPYEKEMQVICKELMENKVRVTITCSHRVILFRADCQSVLLARLR